MQANTSKVANQTVNFHNFSVEKCDPFSIRNGRFVGDDGFVVPKNFAEFHERFPEYVRNWVRRHTGASASREDIEDWTQDLLIHLRYLPLNSRHRDGGKEDVIQTFDPIKHFGANQARFQNYINLCLTNKFRSLHSKRMQDALSQPGNMSLDAQREWNDPHAVDDEFCHSHSVHLRMVAYASEKRHEDRAFVGEFVDFVRSENPRSLFALEGIAVMSTLDEAARTIENTGADFRRAYRQLRKLGRTFLTQEARPQLQERIMAARRTRETNACAAENLRHVQLRSISWNRMELYNEVWSEPLVKLSRKYGISDVRLGKVCRKLKIPHPGRGYWAKKKAGSALQQMPLPEFKDAPVVRRTKRKTTAARLDKVLVRRAAGRECADHEGRGVVERGVIGRRDEQVSQGWLHFSETGKDQTSSRISGDQPMEATQFGSAWRDSVRRRRRRHQSMAL